MKKIVDMSEKEMDKSAKKAIEWTLSKEGKKGINEALKRSEETTDILDDARRVDLDIITLPLYER